MNESRLEMLACPEVCVAACCSVLQRVAACCSMSSRCWHVRSCVVQVLKMCCSVLQYIAACCSVSQCELEILACLKDVWCGVLPCVAVSHSV